jgi:hypothetical protein
MSSTAGKGSTDLGAGMALLGNKLKTTGAEVYRKDKSVQTLLSTVLWGAETLKGPPLCFTCHCYKIYFDLMM